MKFLCHLVIENSQPNPMINLLYIQSSSQLELLKLYLRLLEAPFNPLTFMLFAIFDGGDRWLIFSPFLDLLEQS